MPIEPGKRKDSVSEIVFAPLVKSATTSQSPNVRSIMDEMNDGTYVIPDYQRDSSQWDNEKKSRFIESLINNLTVPPLIVYPEDDPKTGLERRQVVDGQQRLTTIREFLGDRFALSSADDLEYAANVGALIAGKKFSQLDPQIRKQIEKYTLNLIVLPKNIDLSLRLEISSGGSTRRACRSRRTTSVSRRSATRTASSSSASRASSTSRARARAA